MKPLGTYIAALCVILGATVLLFGCILVQNKRLPVHANTFTAADAVARVIKDHKEFPINPSDVNIKRLPTGGDFGAAADVTFTTKVEKVGDATYLVTLTKDWGKTVNGQDAKSHWIYSVTPESVTLSEGVDNDYLLTIMK